MMPGSLEAGNVALLPFRPMNRAVVPNSAIRRVLRTLLLWRLRAAERQTLSLLGDDILRDIGLTRADVDREVMKPFWRA